MASADGQSRPLMVDLDSMGPASFAMSLIGGLCLRWLSHHPSWHSWFNDLDQQVKRRADRRWPDSPATDTSAALCPERQDREAACTHLSRLGFLGLQPARHQDRFSTRHNQCNSGGSSKCHHARQEMDNLGRCGQGLLAHVQNAGMGCSCNRDRQQGSPIYFQAPVTIVCDGWTSHAGERMGIPRIQQSHQPYSHHL